MLTTIVQRGGLTSQLGQSAEEEELYRTGFFSPDLRHLVGEDQAGYPLYFGVNPSFVSIPNNWVSFPMTKPSISNKTPCRKQAALASSLILPVAPRQNARPLGLGRNSRGHDCTSISWLGPQQQAQGDFSSWHCGLPGE
jgi:hypothetical protein